MITLRLTQQDDSPIMEGLNENFVVLPFEKDNKVYTEISMAGHASVIVKESFEEITCIIEQKNIKG